MAFTNITLETDRLLIREFKPTDAKDVNAYSRLPKTVRFLYWGPDTLNQTKGFLRHASKLRTEKPRAGFELVIFLKKENKVIGGCCLRIKSFPNRESDLGYVLHPDYWGNGYATEVSKALIQFGFKKLKLHRIWATCAVKNKASEKVLKKCGMKKEGIVRSCVFLRGQWIDLNLYAILE